MKTHIPGKQILDLTIETPDIANRAVTDEKLSTTGVVGGTYTQVTVNEEGRVVGGQTPTTIQGYGITDAFSTTIANQIPWITVDTGQQAEGDAAFRLLRVNPSELQIIDSGPKNAITLGLAPNAIMPGTGAIALPTGTTEQRPLIGAGKIRYNTTNNVLETPVGAAWKAIVLDNDERLVPDSRVREVRKEPKSYQYGSIAAACASLVGVATENDQWLVDVGPGHYSEPEIIIPSYVHVSGFTEYAVTVEPDTADHPVFTMSRFTTLSFLNIDNASGEGQAAVRMWDVDAGVILHKVAVTNANIGFDIKAITTDAIVYLEYCDTEQSGGIGLNIDSMSDQLRTYANLENFYIYGSDDGNPEIGIRCDGPNTVVYIQSFGMEGSTGTGEAFNMANGSRMDVKAGSIFGWDVGVHMENSGLPSVGNFIGVAFENNTTFDLHSEHPLNTGSLSGSATRDKINAWASPGFTSAFSDTVNNEFVQTGDLYMGKTQELLTNVSDLIIQTPPMGRLTGGVLTPGSGLTVNISAGTGYLRKDGNVTRVEWPDNVATITPNTAVYLFINKNGVLSQASTEPDGSTSIVLGRANAGATTITGLGDLSVDIKSHGNSVEKYLRTVVGPVYISGSIVTENATTPRAIDVTAGTWMYGTMTRHPTARTAATMIDSFRSGGNLSLVPRTQVPNDAFDNGTDLQPLTSGYFMKHSLYSSSEGAFQQFYLARAQAQFATLEEAILAPLPIPRIAAEATPIIASIIVQQGVNSLLDISDVRPMVMRASTGHGGGTSNHGDLLGLTDDDHPQYMLVNGSRSFEGDLSLNGNDISSVGLINNLDITAHGARHAPQGADPIPTGPAIALTPASQNTTGIANTLARSDHTHSVAGLQPYSSELTALSEISKVGILVHAHDNTGTHVWEQRSIAGAGGRIVVTNANGDSGDPTIDLAQIGTAGTYAQVTTDVFGRVTAGTAKLDWTSISNAPSTLSGYGITDAQFKSDILTTLSDLGGTGSFTITGPGTATTRTLIGPAAGITVTNGSGVAGNPTISLSNDLAALENLTTVGFAVRAGNDTWATRIISAPNDGITITYGSGVAGDVTIALEKDLLAVEAISTIGFAVRAGTNTWTTRTLQGASGNIVITSPAGTIGDPTINLATVGTAGTYSLVSTDSFGRVVSGSKPTTLAGYGITDAVSTSLIGANNGLATLDATGKLNGSQLPALAITDTFVVGSQAAMLGLVAETGDVAVRTDLSKSFILRAMPASTVANWQELLTPVPTVSSVNGMTGNVVLNTGVLSISAAAPTAGLTISGGPITTTGTLTFALANDLAAVEGLGTTGFAVRTAADTWTTRTLAGGTGITITNADGLGGSPTISLPNIVTASNYKIVSVDATGRVTSGSNPTTLSGFGITDAISTSAASSTNVANNVVQRDASGNFAANIITASLSGNAATATKLQTARTINGVAFDGTQNIALTATDIGLGNVLNSPQVVNGGNAPRISSGLVSARPAAGTVGAIYFGTDDRNYYRDNGTTWDVMTPQFTGDVTSPIGSNVLTLNNTVTAGTYDRITVNSKGLVVAGDVTTDRMNLMYSGSIPSQTGTSTIALGATAAPTSTQGTLLVSQVITPAATGSRIVIEFSGIIDTGFNGGVFLSFFRGTTCIGVVVSATQAAAGSSTVSMPETFSARIIDTPGVTTAQTYSIRIGGNAAGTWYLGRTAGLSLGGVSRSHWSMTEII